MVKEDLRAVVRWRGVVYWIATGIITAELLFGGVVDLFRWPEVATQWFGVTGIGFPLYFGTILGTWKLLGALALVVPRFPVLKEWAYAGFTFTMTGAIATNLAVGAGLVASVAAAALLLIGAASWWLRPTSRKPVLLRAAKEMFPP